MKLSIIFPVLDKKYSTPYDQYMEKSSPGKYLYVNQQNHPFLGILLILFLFVVTMLVLNFYNIVSFSLVFPQLFGRLPHLPFSTVSVKISANVKRQTIPESKSCQVKEYGTSLVKTEQTINHDNAKFLTGSFYGLITAINENKTDNIFSINLKSLNGEQNHLFNLSPKNTPLVSGSNAKLAYTSLKTGDILTLDFMCDIKTNQFNIYKAEFAGMATVK